MFCRRVGNRHVLVGNFEFGFVGYNGLFEKFERGAMRGYRRGQGHNRQHGTQYRKGSIGVLFRRYGMDWAQEGRALSPQCLFYLLDCLILRLYDSYFYACIRDIFGMRIET